MKKKIIHAIILARGGSKGIKNKNIVIVNKKPLIYWSIKNCLKSKLIKKTWVSSDNNKILEIAKKFGANIIKRPRAISGDTASSEKAWAHAIKEIKKADKLNYVVGVQPTSPIRGLKDFDYAIIKFFKKKYDSLFSACDFETFFTWKIKNNKPYPNYNIANRLRRQKIQRSILENGSFYIFEVNKFLKKNNRLFGNIGFYLMEKYKSFQIDKKNDLFLIEKIFKNLPK